METPRPENPTAHSARGGAELERFVGRMDRASRTRRKSVYDLVLVLEIIQHARSPEVSNAKRILIGFAVYVGIVIAFESMIGFFQPVNQSTLVITTTDASGDANDRVLARLESDGQLFVAANHWPRAWYSRALENPKVQVTIDEETANYLAVPVSDEEHVRVNSDHPSHFLFRLVTGFPPRYFLRLDPIQ